jgi:hypothetical protein
VFQDTQDTANTTQTNVLTYATIAGAPSVTTTGLSAGAHTALVTITQNSTIDTNDVGCMMSFLGGSVTVTGTANDSFAVGNGRMRNNTANPFSGGATYFVTFTGNATFTGQYRETANSVCTWKTSAIVVQVIS